MLLDCMSTRQTARYLSVCLCLRTQFLSVSLSITLSFVCLSVYLCLSACLSVCQAFCLPTCLSESACQPASRQVEMKGDTLKVFYSASH